VRLRCRRTLLLHGLLNNFIDIHGDFPVELKSTVVVIPLRSASLDYCICNRDNPDLAPQSEYFSLNIFNHDAQASAYSEAGTAKDGTHCPLHSPLCGCLLT
jgi:hypothetical protein